MYNIENVFRNFKIVGDYIKSHSYGSGHINDTFKVYVSQGGRVVHYLFQRINSEIFPNPELLMSNISRICNHLNHNSSSRHCMTLILSKTDKPYVVDDSNNFWRAYIFIEDAVGYDIIENEKQAFEAASAFGSFQQKLSNLPGGPLHETISDFHNTPIRFEKFKKIVNEDKLKLCKSISNEINFILAFEDKINYFYDQLAAGKLQMRVTHNDTKLNNVLLDKDSGEAVCIIDLDTCMPGMVAYDFGDLVRTSTCFAAEDEKDTSKITVNKEIYESLIRGYLSTAHKFLTIDEVKSLIFGGILMTYEVGLRFLTDYLEGNIYFKTAYQDHNLVRCRAQITLVKELIKDQDCFEDLALSIYYKYKQK